MNRDDYDEQETARRMNDALKRAFNTPHKPHASLKADRSKRKRGGKAPRSHKPTADNDDGHGA